jgi:hypothetical protein
MLKVYHLTHRTPRAFVECRIVDNAVRYWTGMHPDIHYVHVADVNVEGAVAPEDAFHLTNNIDQPWVRNAGVTVMLEDWQRGIRSTSVGDVVVDAAGVVWFCAPFGWEEMAGVPLIPFAPA